MNASRGDKLVLKFALAQTQQLCPDCGAKMNEIDRRCENGAIFVWYGCSKAGCTGQWLQKTPQYFTKPGVEGDLTYVLR